eukprot:TRINITY_DN5109_c0_g1_i1.p1 TRINITY_DN5109_c0_g1~~TRINITY_DN5109_c0_g1_i1.p1  ORF type:complete len:339 (+),score=73.34 TRINITY_DN5109_c0_g1_i1:843-1859(+)
MLHGFVARVQGRLQESVDTLKIAVERASVGGATQLALTAEYELGHNYFLQCQWESAIPIIEKYLETTKSKNFRAYGAYKLGFCYWMTGKYDVIAPLYSKVEGWVRPNFSFDKFALRKAQEYSQKGKFSKFDEKWISASNFFEGKLFSSALEQVEASFVFICGDTDRGMTEGEVESEIIEADPSVADSQHVDNWTRYLYLKGAALRGLGRLPEATEYLERALGMLGRVSREVYVLPHALVELAEMEIERTLPNKTDLDEEEDDENKSTEAALPVSEAKDESSAEDKVARLQRALAMLKRAQSDFGTYDFDKQLGYRINKNNAKAKAGLKDLQEGEEGNK